MGKYSQQPSGLCDKPPSSPAPAQAVGPGVSELVSSFALAIEAGLRAEDVAGTIHAHPTLSEAFQESALAVASMANHG